MAGTCVAFVGTVGGIGTTRSVLEIGGLLARNGEVVLTIDLDFATQGLGRLVEERPAVDATALLADPDADLDDAVVDWAVDGDGSLGVVPSLAPFVEIADAKTEAAGARVADRLAEAAKRADHVLLDVPPVVSNQAIGAVTAADRVIAVSPPTDRGVDGLQRERGRLADVGGDLDAVLAVGDGDPPPEASAHVPALPADAPSHRPASLGESSSFVRAVADATEHLLDVSVAAPESTNPIERLRSVADRA